MVQLNIALLNADHLTLLFKDAFPDSKIAKKYASRRTKTTAIINKSFAPHYLDYIMEHCKSLELYHGTLLGWCRWLQRYRYCEKITYALKFWCQQIKNSNNPVCRYVFNILCWWFHCRRYIYCYWWGICHELNFLGKLCKFECQQHKHYEWLERTIPLLQFKVLGEKWKCFHCRLPLPRCSHSCKQSPWCFQWIYSS